MQRAEDLEEQDLIVEYEDGYLTIVRTPEWERNQFVLKYYGVELPDGIEYIVDLTVISDRMTLRFEWESVTAIVISEYPQGVRRINIGYGGQGLEVALGDSVLVSDRRP